MRWLAFATLFALSGGCASVNYETTKQGSFKGGVAVVWLKGTEGSGDGTFVYVPTPGNPLTFLRPEGETAAPEITPGMMYTDGGSVPGLARAFNGLTPWNYGPAYIVHDWVYMARQCLNAKEADPIYQDMTDLTFQDSAEIIAESIKALELSGRVKRRDISASAVTFAVTSPFSLALWNKAVCREVSEKDRLEAEAIVGQRPVVGKRDGLRMTTDATGRPVRDYSTQIVAVISF